MNSAETRVGVETAGPRDVGLYAVTVLIWGSTWLAITFQLGAVPPSISVVWRFALSALLLLAYAVFKGLRMNFSLADHAWIALQGLFMFGTNYVLVYSAEQHLASGLVAVTFSLFVFFNIFGMRLFFGEPIKPLAFGGAVLGVIGVVLIFLPQLHDVSGTGDTAYGFGLALTATVAASIGGMIVVRNQRHALPTVQTNALGMGYGAAFVAVFAAAGGEPFLFEWTGAYVASLLYLALFGTVLAFGAYLTLVRNIGPSRAGYISVAVPVVALLLSTLVEGLAWNAAMLAGLALCLTGNVLVLGSKR